MSYPIDETGRDSARTPVQNGWRRSREAPRSLCIVSRDPLRCSELVLSLQASLRPHEDLQIILDRRRDRTSTEAHSDEGERLVERRRHHHVDLALKRNGFAIVPATPIEPVATVALDEADAAEREQLAEIANFTRRRRARRLWVVGAPLAFVLVLFMLLPPVDSLLHQILPEAPPPSKLMNGLPAVVQAPLITGIPAEAPRDRRTEPPGTVDREPSSAQRPGDAARPSRVGANDRSGPNGRGAHRDAPARERRLYAPAVWMPEVTERLVEHAKAAERLTTRTVSRTKVWLTGNARSSRSMSVEVPMGPAQGP
jgi:hypothetical protein